MSKEWHNNNHTGKNILVLAINTRPLSLSLFLSNEIEYAVRRNNDNHNNISIK